MKPLHTRLQEARKRLGLPWQVLERDYVLSWVLAGLTQVDALRDTIVFKGGTALKKCYFGDYRFSGDLDFSGTAGVPVGTAMADAMQDVCQAAARLLDVYAPVEITCERYTERQPHPGGQEAFAIRARLPWQRQAQTRVMVEVTMDERVLKPPTMRPVIHGYDEPLDAAVLVYALEEIVAEKLRAILQHVAKLDERGWSRSRARDYYDLWRILGEYGDDPAREESRLMGLMGAMELMGARHPQRAPTTPTSRHPQAPTSHPQATRRRPRARARSSSLRPASVRGRGRGRGRFTKWAHAGPTGLWAGIRGRLGPAAWGR